VRVLAIVLGLVVVLAVALIVQAAFDSDIAGWIAFGIVGVYAVARLLGALPGSGLGQRFDGD
jgi:hypothetical protein